MKKVLLILFSVIVTGVIFIAFSRNDPSQAAPTHENLASPPEKITQFNFPVTFGSAIPKNPSSPNADSVELITFAWNEFFALNWKSNYRSTALRGHADESWSYKNDQTPYPEDPLVWETYAHRVEVRPYDDNRLPFDKVPKYVYEVPFEAQPGVDLTLFNNLDEGNEIGSCNLYADISQFNQKKIQVLYQAKVNRDEYKYVYDTFKDSFKLKTAQHNTATNIQMFKAYYQPGRYPGYDNSTCNCPPQANVFCLPCGGAKVPGTTRTIYTGALEVKTAWREISLAEVPRYFIRKVIVYVKSNNKIIPQNKYYGLIGIHIIHKTVNFPNFIFATFEHKDVEKSDMGYIRLDTVPIPLVPQRYNRAHPIPAVVDSSTAYVHRELRKLNPNSIWQNYRLVGVQGNPTNDPTSFSFYLANYVIESDPPLAYFRGSSLKKPFDNGPNSLHNGKLYSMGGCQGCHGVTQLRGSDCSFVMGLVDQPHALPDATGDPKKFQLYKNAFDDIFTKENKTAAKH
ncbi:hypothetical protein [Chitinophaga nivalis]|uniref:Cytochrome c domain-containing protein n=1 Tax=Chitinophaga nivalis TaxID=2991709 RepID=A0ABT3IH63_9BACT|nr:hypothetical protein [Chitinophaga nivalis]MCW3467009.1 hypothetical protein [Chitinophaga nivalis]MCW3483300.1 hypothetical protein [Chitinophaga nivalis]